MKVLLSIKPKYAEKIFNGEKKFEFRKAIFKNQNVATIIVYASSPVCRVIGEFEIDSIIETEIGNLWNKTCKYSGISRDFFFDYFSEKQVGYAIKVKKYKKYKKPLELFENFGIQPPQSFAYVKSIDLRAEKRMDLPKRSPQHIVQH